MNNTAGRKVIFTALAVLALVFAGSTARAQQKKPNILIIWGDDIGGFNVSAYNQGVMGYKTPNIDRIVREGRSSPIGTASRVALPAAPRSLPGSRLSVPVSLKSACPERRKV